jgi:hypothetical protein
MLGFMGGLLASMIVVVVVALITAATMVMWQPLIVGGATIAGILIVAFALHTLMI